MTISTNDPVAQQETATATTAFPVHDTGTAALLTFPDLTCEHLWGDRIGSWRLTLDTPETHSTWNVFVRISEFDELRDQLGPGAEADALLRPDARGLRRPRGSKGCQCGYLRPRKRRSFTPLCRTSRCTPDQAVRGKRGTEP
jgi:hypothetical protein